MSTVAEVVDSIRNQIEDLKDIHLENVPDLIKNAIEIVNSSRDLSAEQKQELISESIITFLSLTKIPEEAFELVPMIVNSVLTVKDGKLQFSDALKSFWMKVKLCFEKRRIIRQLKCDAKSESKNLRTNYRQDLQRLKLEYKENVKISSSKLETLDFKQKFTNDMNDLTEKYNNDSKIIWEIYQEKVENLEFES